MTRLPISERGQSDWLSMWFEWPMTFYREWLKMLQPEALPIKPMSMPEFELSEDEKEMVLVAEAPDFAGDELEATIKKNVLNIKGEHHQEIGGGEVHVTYDQKVPLPPSVNVKEAKTSLRDGIVEVRIPKLPGIEPQRSPVEDGKSQGKSGEAELSEIVDMEPRKAASHKGGRAPGKRWPPNAAERSRRQPKRPDPGSPKAADG